MTTYSPSHTVGNPSTRDERSFAVGVHLVGLLSMATGIPLAGLVGVLIMWLIKGKQSAFIDGHGREAMNFQISILIYALVVAVCIGGLAVISFGLESPLLLLLVVPLCFLAWFAAALLVLIGCIRGAIFANRGQMYRYPLSMRLLVASIAGSDPAAATVDGPSRL